MTGPAAFTPQPYPLRLIERVWGRPFRTGMIIGWLSDATGWKPVVAFDGEVAAVEATTAENGIWEYQVPEPAPRPPMPYESKVEPGSATEVPQGADTATEAVLSHFRSDKPKEREKPGRKASSLAPDLPPKKQE